MTPINWDRLLDGGSYTCDPVAMGTTLPTLRSRAYYEAKKRGLAVRTEEVPGSMELIISLKDQTPLTMDLPAGVRTTPQMTPAQEQAIRAKVMQQQYPAQPLPRHSTLDALLATKPQPVPQPAEPVAQEQIDMSTDIFDGEDDLSMEKAFRLAGITRCPPVMSSVNPGTWLGGEITEEEALKLAAVGLGISNTGQVYVQVDGDDDTCDCGQWPNCQPLCTSYLAGAVRPVDPSSNGHRPPSPDLAPGS